MHDAIKKDLLSVLEQLMKILKAKEDTDITQIKELSNHIIHTASIFQDEDSVSVAILIYSLSKIIERKKRDIDYGKILVLLNSCVDQLKRNDDDTFRLAIKNVFNFIRSADEKLKMYIHEVINHAQIKKGCKLCEHGISVARASEVLGISQWELMQYMGETTITERFSEPVNVIKRIKMARSLFS